MARKHLAVVDPSAPLEPKQPKSVVEAAKDGDDLAMLQAAKVHIAKAIQDEKTPAVALAALSKRLTDITDEIAKLRAREPGGELLDDIEDDEAFDAAAI